MKSLLLTSLLALVSVCAASDLNAPPAGLSAEARQEIVTRLHELSTGAAWWAEYYSYGPVDRAYHMGRAEGLAVAAALLEANE